MSDNLLANLTHSTSARTTFTSNMQHHFRRLTVAIVLLTVLLTTAEAGKKRKIKKVLSIVGLATLIKKPKLLPLPFPFPVVVEKHHPYPVHEPYIVSEPIVWHKELIHHHHTHSEPIFLPAHAESIPEFIHVPSPEVAHHSFHHASHSLPEHVPEYEPIKFSKHHHHHHSSLKHHYPEYHHSHHSPIKHHVPLKHHHVHHEPVHHGHHVVPHHAGIHGGLGHHYLPVASEPGYSLLGSNLEILDRSDLAEPEPEGEKVIF